MVVSAALWVQWQVHLWVDEGWLLGLPLESLSTFSVLPGPHSNVTLVLLGKGTLNPNLLDFTLKVGEESSRRVRVPARVPSLGFLPLLYLLFSLLYIHKGVTLIPR